MTWEESGEEEVGGGGGGGGELGSKEEERCLRKLKGLKTQREDKVSMSKHGKDEMEEKRGDV